MIGVFAELNNTSLTTNWPSFTTMDEAMEYIKYNSGEFENGEIIAIVDFQNLKTKFVRAELTMTFREIDS